jgi:hypothetical protein
MAQKYYPLFTDPGYPTGSLVADGLPMATGYTPPESGFTSGFTSAFTSGTASPLEFSDGSQDQDDIAERLPGALAGAGPVDGLDKSGENTPRRRRRCESPRTLALRKQRRYVGVCFFCYFFFFFFYYFLSPPYGT